jgi:hypothetical protein
VATYLFRVAETFDISDRGRIVVSDTKIMDIPFVLRAGSNIELRLPDGKVMATQIKGLEHSRPFSPYRAYAFLIGDEAEKVPMPAGSEVWLLDPVPGL